MSWESDVSREWKLGLDGTGSAQGVIPARAATNQVWVVQANAGALVDNMVSEEDSDGGCHGQSRVVDPAGRVREQARIFGEQLLVHDLDLNMCSRPEYKMSRRSIQSRVFGAMWTEGARAFNGPQMPIDW
jgi:predicted amidohydrolase